MASYGVYVLELKGSDEPTALASLYVGCSWHAAATRSAQHHDGHRTGSPAVNGRVRRLRPELYDDIPWTEYRSEAISRKRLSARRLAEAGFHVRCDGRIYTCTPGERQPFTRHELDAVAGQFDEHVRGILDEALRPLSALDVAHVLRWTRQDRSVRDLVPTPNEHVGRFAYVSERAVLARLLDVFGGRLATMTHTPKGPGQPWTSASGPAERPAAVPAPASRRLR